MNTNSATRSGWLAARCSERSAPRESDTSTASLGAGRVHDGERIGGELLLAIRVGLEWPVRAAVAAAVERQHSAVPREVRESASSSGASG